MIIDTLNVYLFKAFRPYYNKKLKKKLRNKDFSLISINCVGGIVSHDLGLQFRSPFINLWMTPKDFLKICSNLEYYMGVELTEFTTEDGIDYPIGLLDGMKIYFMHYSSEEEARTKWNERRKRVNFSDLYLLLQEQENTPYEVLKAFDELPYKKVIFTHKEYEGLTSAFYIRGFENQNGSMNLLHVVNPIHRKADDFDFVKWLNEGC